MKKIVFLGSSGVAAGCIETIRAADKDSEMTLVSSENHLPYQRHLFPDYICKNINYKQVLSKPAKFYDENKVETMLFKKIVKVNFRKNHIVCDEKELIPFDVLVITDIADQKFPEIKGTNKFGIYGISTLNEIEEIVSRLNFTDTVVIQSQSIEGLVVASALKQRAKEVIFIASDQHPVFSLLEKEFADKIIQSLQSKGVAVYWDNEIVEVLGDAEAKAVRLKSKKVIASEIIIFDDAKPNLRLFADSPLQIQDGIMINDFHEAKIENIYAVDRVCQRVDDKYSSVDLTGQRIAEQSTICAQKILGKNLESSSIPAAGTQNLYDTLMHLFGQVTSTQH